tara:strand:- start:2289 stop:2723 length:435 start_codon:yes stop_codon:yes gene_type:complete
MILKLYKKLCLYFKRKKEETSPKEDKTDNNTIGTIQFSVLESKDIEIKCSIETNAESDTDQFMANAESYSKMLVMINSGFLKNSILDMLKENYEGIDPDNIDNKLFISNIISLYTFMDQMNNRAESKYKSPIIRPTLVFKQYQS